MSDENKTVVLVADDEPSTLALVSGHLRAKGYRVIEATDGDQAWELAHEHLPHVVVLDVMMPGMSGWEVCRKIREAVSLAHTGVVMLTGIGENLNEMTSPLYGADAYVDKPFEFADLDEKIELTLSQRESGALGRPDHADVTSEVDEPEGGEVRKRKRKKARPKEPALRLAQETFTERLTKGAKSIVDALRPGRRTKLQKPPAAEKPAEPATFETSSEQQASERRPMAKPRNAKRRTAARETPKVKPARRASRARAANAASTKPAKRKSKTATKPKTTRIAAKKAKAKPARAAKPKRTAQSKKSSSAKRAASKSRTKAPKAGRAKAKRSK